MEYYRGTALRSLKKVVLFSFVLYGILESEVVNSKENKTPLAFSKGCSLRPGKSQSYYEEAVIGIGWISRKCAPGSEFKHTDCRCSVPNLKANIFGKKHSTINVEGEVHSKRQNKSLSLPRNIFKYQHLSPSSSESLPENIFADKKKSQIGTDFGPTTDDDNLIELLPGPHMKSTSPTVATVTDTTIKDGMRSKTMHFLTEYVKSEISKSPPVGKAEQSFNRIQSGTSTMKMKELNNIISDNLKLSISEWADILSSMHKISKTESKDKNIKISKLQTLFTTLKSTLTTKFKSRKQSGAWQETKHAKDDKKTSMTNITREVLGKNQSLGDTKFSSVATTRQHPKVVLDYFSVTISKPFGAFDLSKNIPSYLSAENWQKSRLPVIKTEKRGRNRPSNSRFSKDDITSTNQQPKLRERTAGPKSLTIKQRNEVLSSGNFKGSSPETYRRDYTGIIRRPYPINVLKIRKPESKESQFESAALKNKTYKMFRNLVFPAFKLFQNTRSTSKDLKIDLHKIDFKYLIDINLKKKKT